MRDSSGSKRSRRLWYWLLLVPLLATAFPALYVNGPPLLGLPFFYWYQMAWGTFGLSGLIGIVYYATRETGRR